jgi:hypothetical protein
MYISAALGDTQGALMYTQRARNLAFFLYRRLTRRRRRRVSEYFLGKLRLNIFDHLVTLRVCSLS